MLVLYESSILVQHISEMSFNFISNHCGHPILEVFHEIIITEQRLSYTGEALLIFILFHRCSLILL